MKTTRTLLFCAALFLAACGTKTTPTQLPEALPAQSIPRDPTATARDVPAPAPKGAVDRPLPVERGELFATSGVCSVCHTRLVDASGADVSIDAAWRSTMMANSTRDPYWRATLSSEVLKQPDYQGTIEDKCTTCHAPMARHTAFANGKMGKALDDGFFDPAHRLHTLSMDGVSCTQCHQILAEGFGAPESFSGHYVIDTDTPLGQRETFGPFFVDPSQAATMSGSSGFLPMESQHVRQSELCAVCHTLYTPYLDDAGQIVGEFPEQTPYLEWRDSDYVDTHACQSCHMPQAEGGVVLSVTGGEPRAPFHQHPFVGGNTFILSMLLQYDDVLETTATRPQFGATLHRVLDQLQNHTATVGIEGADLSDGRLSAVVSVDSQTGHKLPTSYPSRRVWLHFVVRDAGGTVVFESGAANPDGSIVGNDNDGDAASFEPHYQRIDDPSQVQIYEAIMANTDGEVTTTLLRAASYLKDNRLLPSGFESAHPDIAVQGVAAGDPDFVAGGDRVQYQVELSPDAPEPFSVTAELMYQAIGYRWADNLNQLSSPEIDRFRELSASVANGSVVIDRVTLDVGE